MVIIWRYVISSEGSKLLENLTEHIYLKRKKTQNWTFWFNSFLHWHSAVAVTASPKFPCLQWFSFPASSNEASNAAKLNLAPAECTIPIFSAVKVRLQQRTG